MKYTKKVNKKYVQGLCVSSRNKYGLVRIKVIAERRV